MKDSDWQILYELYKTPNITKVANRLFITQPCLTKRVQRIEDIFQVQVLNRTTKGVQFTEEGTVLAIKAMQYMKFIKEIESELSYLKDVEGNTIKIASSYTFTKNLLPTIMSDYAECESQINFQVVSDESGVLFDKICENEVDVAFIRGDYEGPVVQKLLCTNKAYLMTNKADENRDLASLRKIEYKCSDKTHQLIDNWLGDIQSPVMSAGYIDVALDLVERNLGYVCCFIDNNFENTRNLAMTPMLDKDGHSITRNTWLVYKDTKSLPAYVRNFIEFVMENFSELN